MPAKGGLLGPHGPHPGPWDPALGSQGPHPGPQGPPWGGDRAMGERGPARPRRRGSDLPVSPGRARAQHIRSGPEGARGVLEGRGLSLCMLLSALSSALSSPNSCGFSSEALCVLLICMCLWDSRMSRGLLGRALVFQLFFRIGFWMVF